MKIYSMTPYIKVRVSLQGTRFAFSDREYKREVFFRVAPFADNNLRMTGSLPAELSLCQGNAIGAVMQAVITILRSMCESS